MHHVGEVAGGRRQQPQPRQPLRRRLRQPRGQLDRAQPRGPLQRLVRQHPVGSGAQRAGQAAGQDRGDGVGEVVGVEELPHRCPLAQGQQARHLEGARHHRVHAGPHHGGGPQHGRGDARQRPRGALPDLLHRQQVSDEAVVGGGQQRGVVGQRHRCVGQRPVHHRAAHEHQPPGARRGRGGHHGAHRRLGPLAAAGGRGGQRGPQVAVEGDVHHGRGCARHGRPGGHGGEHVGRGEVHGHAQQPPRGAAAVVVVVVVLALERQDRRGGGLRGVLQGDDDGPRGRQAPGHRPARRRLRARDHDVAVQGQRGRCPAVDQVRHPCSSAAGQSTAPRSSEVTVRSLRASLRGGHRPLSLGTVGEEVGRHILPPRPGGGRRTASAPP